MRGQIAGAPRGELIFYTKPKCPLCDSAWVVAVRVAREMKLELRRVNILEDGELLKKHQYRIPVIELDGEEIAWGRIDADDMVARLARLLRRSG